VAGGIKMSSSSESTDVGDEGLTEDGFHQHSTESSVLAASRARYAKELEDPVVRARLFNSIKAEVGGQDEATKLKYLETVLNRAASRGMTIYDTVSSAHRNGGYYPDSTINQLDDKNPPDFSGILARAMDGSNTSRYATGNESKDVHSGGAPVVSVGNKEERFIIENADTKWAKSQGSDLKPIVSSGKVPGTKGESQPAEQEAVVKPYTPATQQQASASETAVEPAGQLPEPKPWLKRAATQEQLKSTESEDTEGLYASGVPSTVQKTAERGPAKSSSDEEEEQPNVLADILGQVRDQYG
jgi:hypothetical protein